MKMKRKVAIILMAAMFITSLLFTACSDRAEKANLVGFPETITEQVKLGSSYSLRRIVEDDKGNAYTLTAAVKTKSGSDVQIVLNEFTVTVMDGYTITYTAAISENDTQKSVVTVIVYDDDPPTIIINKPSAGIVGRKYTLPNILIEDPSGIDEQSIKVFLVDGTNLIEQTVAFDENKYTFTPTIKGIYRISVYAKDNSGHEITSEREFTVDVLNDGEVFNPKSLNALDQISSNKDPDTGYELVSEEDNTDTDYSGAYWRVITPSTGWLNLFLVPRLDLSEYAEYDFISFWFYVEYPSQGGMSMAILNDTTLQKSFESNTWTEVKIPIDKFLDKINNQYFCAINLLNVNSAIRFGEVTAKKEVQFTTNWNILNTDDGIATGEFTVGSELSDVPPYVLEIRDSNQNLVDYDSRDENIFTYKLSADTYTYNIVSTGIYYGKLTGQFTVDTSGTQIRIEGNYPAKINIGNDITLIEGKIWLNGVITNNKADITIKQKDYNTGEETDVTSQISDGEFTVNTVGKYIITYTYPDALQVVKIVDTYIEGEIFNPYAEGSDSQLKANGTMNYQFVAAEDNNNTTYSGAYWKLQSPTAVSWRNFYLSPSLDLTEYADYDVISFWIYAGFPTQGSFNVALFHNSSYQQVIQTNTWTQITVDMQGYRDYYTANQGASGNPYFLAVTFSSQIDTFICFGEVMGKYDAKYTTSDWDIGTATSAELATVNFSVGSELASIPEYVLTVKNFGGDTIAFVSKEGNNYTFKLEAGSYTYNVTPVNSSYHGQLTGSFDVEGTASIRINGTYPDKVNADTTITLYEGIIMIGGSDTIDRADIIILHKDYSTGIETDITSQISDGEFTVDAFGKYIITYSYPDALQVIKIVDTYIEGEIFNPYAEGSDSQIRANGTMNYQFVAAEDNDNTTYSGAYWKLQSPTAITWRNFYLTPSLELSEYSEYDYISFWVYVGYPTQGNINLALFNNANYAQSIPTNTWKQITVNMEGYRDYYTANQGASGNPYFIAITFGSQSSAYICFGEVTGKYDAKYTTSEWYIGTETATELATVTFSVGSELSTIPEYVLTVKNTGGNIIAYDSKEGNVYTYKLEAGEYTYTISPINVNYYGQSTGSFNVDGQESIVVDGTYEKRVNIGDIINIIDGDIYESGVITDKTANVILTLIDYNSGAQTDVTNQVSNGEYITDVAGLLVITYTYADLESIEFVIYIVDSTYEGEIAFLPEATDSKEQLRCNNPATFTFVSEVDNDDEVYSGAYWKLTPSNTGWNNFYLTINEPSRFAEYDYVSVWFYVKTSTDPALITLPFFNNVNHRQTFMTNTWTRIRLDAAFFAANISNTNQIFITASFGSVTDFYLGEISGAFSTGISTINIFDPEDFTHVKGSGLLYTSKDTLPEPGTQYEFVSAEDNEDEIYGDAYWKLTPPSTSWMNFFLRPDDLTIYADYDYISVWLYIANTNSSGGINLAILNEAGLAQAVQFNQWTEVKINAASFVTRAGGQYLFAINLPTVDGVYIGEINGINIR